VRHIITIAGVVGLLLAGAPAFAAGAQAPRPAPSPAITSSSQGQPGDSTTSHTIVIDGRTIPYDATAGTITVSDPHDQTEASMFYVAYTESGLGDTSHRPVTFLYNGGPGSSTIWLRMGSFGPKRVVVGDAEPTANAPFQLVDNEDSLLDKTDLVFVDAVGTGFSRILKGQPKDFYGVDQDVAAFGDFVQRYVTQNDRWNSPKFLFGESYGTPRTCGLVDYLWNNGIQVNGIILQSSVLNFQEFADGDGNDEQFIAYLPTEAAIAWYHHKAIGASGDLATFVSQAKQFAIGEYADALFKGAWLSSGERDDVVTKMHDFMGLPERFIRNADLRVEPQDFEKQLLHAQGEIAGRLDGRFTGIDETPTGEAPDYDPSNTYIEGAYVAAFNQYVRDDLKYRTDLEYLPTNYGEINANWDITHDFNGQHFAVADMMPDLKDAMVENPTMKVFSANGYYDMATPFFGTDYLLAHLGIPPSLQRNITYGYYESGHMIYVHLPALAQYKADLARFYDDATR
jgi:carboxypeptidase C (cathepsin A)